MDLPRTGIGDVPGITSDGILGGSPGISILGLDVEKVGDEGGWAVTLSGIFSTFVGFYVYCEATGVSERAYSGVIGQGDVCWSADGSELSFISPPLPVGEGYTIRVIATDGSLEGSLPDALPVWKRTYTTNLYNLRSHHPPPRAVGAYQPEFEKWDIRYTGDNDTMYSALLTALADTLQETHGFLVTRVYESAAAGFSTLRCEGLHRWPSSGRFALAGRMYRYTGCDAVFTGGTPATAHYCRLTGVTEDDGATATAAGVVQGDVLVYMGADDTDIDRLRQSFFVETCTDSDLDTLGRNYGLRRPRGLGTEDYRALLKVLIYLPAQTLYAVEKVLDVLRGEGNYEVYELFPQPGEFNRFYVVLTSGGGGPLGASYMTAFELLEPVGDTVTVSKPPTVVNGVWADSDPFRTGTNYAEAIVGVEKVAPDRLRTSYDFWEAADLGRSVRLSDGELWRITAVLDPTTVQVASPARTDGLVNGATPTQLTAGTSFFRSWMEGHTLVVNGDGPGNSGSFVIAEVLTQQVVSVVGAAFTTETNVDFQVQPDFSGGGAVAAAVMRATIDGYDVSCPNTLPASVYVDYATTPSAEAVVDGFTSGADQYPFYLFDDTFIVALVLDIIRAAGVEAVVLLE